jgi:hypothetical protein
VNCTSVELLLKIRMPGAQGRQGCTPCTHRVGGLRVRTLPGVMADLHNPSTQEDPAGEAGGVGLQTSTGLKKIKKKNSGAH